MPVADTVTSMLALRGRWWTRKYAVSQAVSVEETAPVEGKIVHDRPPMLAIGVMIWLGSELMFFSGLFAAFFTIRAGAPGGIWPPPGTKLDTIQAAIFTFILVCSSFTMQTASGTLSGADGVRPDSGSP